MIQNKKNRQGIYLFLIIALPIIFFLLLFGGMIFTPDDYSEDVKPKQDAGFWKFKDRTPTSQYQSNVTNSAEIAREIFLDLEGMLMVILAAVFVGVNVVIILPMVRRMF